ncbi:MAG: hypothetical protein J5950_06000 [Clostridia bacterium]|nr:hypothetical protein [Clostridia bacterium]
MNKRGLALLIAIIILGSCIAFTACDKIMGGGSKLFSVSDKRVKIAASDGKDTLWILAKGKFIEAEKGKLNTSSGVNVLQNAAGDKAAISVVLNNDSTKLLYFDGEKVSEIATAKEDSYFYDAVISADGNGVAYSLWDNDKEELSLYLFDGKKVEKIAKNAHIMAISPNGKTVCYKKYSKDGDSYSEDFRGCFYTGGEEYSLGNYSTPFAIADNAKYVYFEREASDGSTVIYVQKKDNEDSRQKIMNISDGFNSCAFNCDCSQAIYTVSDRGTYIVKDGAEPQKLTSKECYPLAPDNTEYAYYDKSFEGAGYYNICTSGISDFTSDKLVWTTMSGGYVTGIFKITKDGTETLVSGEDMYHVMLAEDLHTVIYVKDGTLWAIDSSAKDPEPVKILNVTEVYKWEVPNDGYTVYYVDEFYDFYAKKGSEKATKIMEANDEAAQSIRTFKGDLYLIYEGELYTSSGGKAVKLEGAGKDLDYMMVIGSSLLVQNKSGEYITTADGKTFSKFDGSK